ncbi:MAG: MFS transporter [Hyphomicrobiales bacterium]
MICSLGACLELFDFSLFLFLIDSIRGVFFPGSSGSSGLLLTLVIFSSGSLMRPIGGLFFGHIGDKFGRKKAFQLSVTLMAISSAAIAILPPASSVGAIAPVLLLLVRMLQGFSIGGEIPGSCVYASEYFPKNRGYVVGLIFLGITYGNLLASAMIGIVRAFMSDHAFNIYGWRICFLVGGLMGILAFNLRKKFAETPVFMEMKERRLKIPAKQLFVKSWKDVVSGFFAVGTTATSLFVLVRMPDYMEKFCNVTFQNVQVYTSYMFVILGIGVVFWGYLSDFISRRLIMTIGCVMVIILSFVSFKVLNGTSSMPLVYIMSTLVAFALSIPNGIYACYILEKFPAIYRLSGLSICYNLGFAIFDGAFPLLITLFLLSQNSLVAVAYSLSIPAFLSLIFTFFSSDHSRRTLKF